jgi:5-methylcytosine-specific restriction endonuclease McrA
MPIKDPEIRREYYRRYMQKNGEKYNLRKLVSDYLSMHPCVDCGESDIDVLEFDHRNPEEKRFTIARYRNSRSVTPSTMMNEITKCDVRCANCHRKKTVRESRAGIYKPNVSPRIKFREGTRT